MNTEAILDTWRAWDVPLSVRPQMVAALGGGRSNRSLLLQSNGTKMVLRINAQNDLLPNRRDSEARTWRAAYEAGIAPPLLYADPDGIFLVSAFIENALPQRPASDAALVHKAFDLLRRCHALEVDVPAIDYAAHVDGYWQVIERQGLAIEPALQAQREPMSRLLEALLDGNITTGVCHHDPVQENFVGSPAKLYLLDWEYAARGLPLMDYAALAVEWEIDSLTVAEKTGLEPGLIAGARSIYCYLCALWEGVKVS